MTLLSRLGPIVFILLTVVVCALPWGFPPEFRLVMPLLPYIAIHVCVERYGHATPDWLVFLAGFLTDVAGQGPLGYWALIYLCGYTMIRSVTTDRTHGAISSILLFVFIVMILTMMQWSVASIYYLRAVDVLPLVVAAVAATGAYLVVLLMLPRAPAEPARDNPRLERGM